MLTRDIKSLCAIFLSIAVSCSPVSSRQTESFDQGELETAEFENAVANAAQLTNEAKTTLTPTPS